MVCEAQAETCVKWEVTEDVEVQFCGENQQTGRSGLRLKCDVHGDDGFLAYLEMFELEAGSSIQF